MRTLIAITVLAVATVAQGPDFGSITSLAESEATKVFTIQTSMPETGRPSGETPGPVGLPTCTMPGCNEPSSGSDGDIMTIQTSMPSSASGGVSDSGSGGGQRPTQTSSSPSISGANSASQPPPLSTVSSLHLSSSHRSVSGSPSASTSSPNGAPQLVMSFTTLLMGIATTLMFNV